MTFRRLYLLRPCALKPYTPGLGIRSPEHSSLSLAMYLESPSLRVILYNASLLMFFSSNA